MAALSLSVVGGSSAAEPIDDGERLDWSSWQAMPVMDAGRRMPLDSFARETVRAVCGRENPRLDLGGKTTGGSPTRKTSLGAETSTESSPVPASSKGLSENHQPGSPRPENFRLSDSFGTGSKKFSAAELVFAWLAETEKWQDVAFLRCGNEALRKDVFGLPLRDAEGRRLRHVSPRCLEESAAFRRRLDELHAAEREAAAAGREFTLGATDEAIAELNAAYGVYRALVFDPRRPATARRRFFNVLGEVIRVWRVELAANLAPWMRMQEQDRLASAAQRVDRSLTQLASLYHKDSFPLVDAETPAAELRDAAAALYEFFSNACERASEVVEESSGHSQNTNAFDDKKTPATTLSTPGDSKTFEHVRAMVCRMAARTDTLARLADGLQRSLFDDGRCLRVVPALDRWALELQRDPGHCAQPWLALGEVLYGSPQTLRGYPHDKVDAVRTALDEAKAAYADRDAADRPARFARAMRRLTAAMRRLGEAIELAREDLPIEKKDAALMAATAYPPPGFTAVEVFYNRLDPFCWSWVLTLCALLCFCLMFGVLSRPMFLLGLAVLVVGQGFTILGLWLRAAITGMVPVTNMFETVLFVALTVTLLGIWFVLLPVTWPGLSRAWQLTALAAPARFATAGHGVVALRICLLVLRALLSCAIVYLLAIGDFNPSGDGPVLGLLPGSACGGLGALGSTLVLWAVGLPIFLWTIWFFPRAIPAALLGVVLVPQTLAEQGVRQTLDAAMRRRVFAVSGAAVALIAYLVAYYAPGPVFNRGVGLGMAAVLRNNFWLTVHVLIITASYGAGALAWALGNVSLGLYAFGRYVQDQAVPSDAAAAGGGKTVRPAVRPPQTCATLAGYIYRVVQLAVLLLAAGTITGAIWADFAWGRYWGWDPKEVWALVTLLVYMVILHGRWAGWTGDFGMAVGAVLGATSIMITWYGVNFIIAGGLHSYGFGRGGQTPVLVIVGCNWGFVAFAALRYYCRLLAAR